MADSKARIRRDLDRWRVIKRQKGQWLLHWEDLARLMVPRRLGFVSQLVEGERRTEEIYDATGMRSARGLANAVGSLLRPEGEKFFLIRAEDERLNRMDEVLDWLRMAEERLLNALLNPKARFRQAVGEADLDLVVFGTAVVFSGLSSTSRRLQFNTIDLKDIDIALNEEEIPDTVFRQRKFTLRQAEKKFDKENLSNDLRSRLETRDEASLEEKVSFLRIVQPRSNGRGDALLTRKMPYTDNWV